MNLNLKPFLFSIAIIILLFIGIGIWRNALAGKSPELWDEQYGRMMKPVVLALFFLFGLMMVPVCLKLFVMMQEKAGNENIGRVKWVSTNAKQIMLTIWAVFILGLGVALPYMIKDGFFKPEMPGQKNYEVNP